MKLINKDKMEVAFDIKKIESAVLGAMEAVNEINVDIAKDISRSIEKKYTEMNLSTIDVETVQVDVENELMTYEQYNAAKEYIIYRNNKTKLRENPFPDNELDERQKFIFAKYLKPNETKKQFIDRISLGKHSLAKIFRQKEALWGGRNLFAIGREGKITGSNCYCTNPPEDNLESIYETDYKIAKTYSYGGGQGLNISRIRPAGMKVSNSSGTTPGPEIFIEKYSHTTLNTQQENRRGALMVVMNINHPDILKFIGMKLDLNKANGANISIGITDEFFRAVEEDKDWEMTFETEHEILTRKVKAADLLKAIAFTNHQVGDPGMLFLDAVNSYHLLTEYEDIYYEQTNPCGEQPLSGGSSCNLASINLFAFVRNPFTKNVYFDYNRFTEVVHEMVNGLDELLDIFKDNHPLPEQKQQVEDFREIGLGVMGLADLALGFCRAYGSDDFIKLINDIMKTLSNEAAIASALRAKKMGSFPKYDADKILNSTFAKSVYTEATLNLIEQFGLRNSRLLSIAPTGSISNLLGVSGGVEPFFNLGYQREVRSIEGGKFIWIYEKTPQELMNQLNISSLDELPEWARVTSQNIDFKERAKVQAVLQKYVDTGISSTFNVPQEATVEDIEDIYTTGYKLRLKGATVFRDKCAKLGILTSGNNEVETKFDSLKIPVTTIVKNKKTGDVEQTTYEHFYQVGSQDTSIKLEKKSHLCPLCGAPLVKQIGCTKCSSEECYYEKCAL